MIPRRIWINLGAFLLLFALLTNWAVRNVLRLDLIERPYQISAAFESSPGLRPNVEVTYHGVRVGIVDSVGLEDDHVRVGIDIDREIRLPEGITAGVRRKSAVGEPYVALEPPAGYDGGGPYIQPGDDYAIGIESTSIPLAYGELFLSLDELVDAIPRDDLSTVVHELAVALDGRGAQLRSLIQSTDQVTGTLASRADVLDALAGELTSLTHIIAERSSAVGASFDNLAALTDTLARARGDVETLLETAPDFGSKVATLLDATVQDLGCTFDSIGSLFSAIGTDAHVAELRTLLEFAGAARDALNAALVHPGEDGADGYYLGGSFVPEFGQAPPAYSPRPTLPVPPALDVCQAERPPAHVGSGDRGVGAGGPSVTAPAGSREPAPPPEVAAQVPASSDADAGSDKFPVGLAIALFALAVAGVVLYTLRPWQRFAAGAAGDEDDIRDLDD